MRRLGLLLALTALGCGDTTSLLVEVTSPLAVPDEVDQLQIAVTGDGGNMVDRRYDLSSGWPHTVSLRPGAMERGGVTITVTALSGGAFVARRVVRSAFVSGMQIRVSVEIPRECVGVMCGAGRDCVMGVCQGVDDPDGGVDAGRPDGGGGPCMGAADCNDGVACTVDACMDGACVHTPDDALCLEGTTCDVVDGCPARTCTTDEDCDDRRTCNGTELCDAMVCVAGTPVDCDDGDPCTADRCDEAARGECTHRTRDADGDGFGDAMCPEMGGVPATDCADMNPDVNPDGIETCNGLDDDCAGGCDDGFGCCRGAEETCPTACGTMGRRVCDGACTWSLCSPPPEECNGVDDDCNGAPDDIFACVLGATEACTTMCGSPGTRTCDTGCTWSACSSGTEVCNGRDDDCNGTPDDGFACVAGTTTACATSCDPVGSTTGRRTCDGTTCTLGACDPPPEGCTGRDDDCDGNTDESTECATGAMETCTTSCGSMGSRSCDATCRFGACLPPAETCNGADDDCDGTIDEGFTCVPSSTRSCTTGCSTMGTETCQADCTWGTCAAPAEACNGRDDDCDTMCDETFACCAGSMGSCTTSCGSMGTRSCSASCGWSMCAPPAETCNGADDDCDGTCDDGFDCCAGRAGPCTTSCGSTGTRACRTDCTFDTACTAPAETCNGMDDDCDSMTDEGFACTPPSTQFCTTSCGSTGTQSCDATCGWGACTPPTELCNGVDDDCDTMTDEGCGACSACTGAISVSSPGGRYTVPLGPHAHTGTCGGAGSEGYLTFTTTAVSDVFITTHGTGAMDTVLYVRECACAGGSQVACNDDGDGLGTSVIRLPSLPAGTYNVIVDTKAPTTGSAIVDLYISAPGPASDRCGNPTFIPAGTASLTGDTCAFASDYRPGAADTCIYAGSGGANDRVYYVYLPTSRTVTVNGCQAGSAHDQTVYLRNVCSLDGVANVPACNDDGCGGMRSCTRGLRSTITTTIGPGLFYLFADGYAGGTCDCGAFEYALSGI